MRKSSRAPGYDTFSEMVLSTMAPAPSSEAQLFTNVTGLAGEFGLLWHHCNNSRRCSGKKGLADLIIAGERGHIFRELKDNYNSTSPDQDLWGYTLLKSADGQASFSERPLLWAVWTPEDWESGRVRAELEAIR